MEINDQNSGDDNVFSSHKASISGRFIAEWATALTAQSFDCTILAPPGIWSPSQVSRLNYRDPLGTLNGFGVPDRWSNRPVKTALLSTIPTLAMSQRAWSVAPKFDFLIGHWLVPSTLVALGAGRRRCTGVHGYAHGGDVALLESLPTVVGRRLSRALHDKAAGLTMVSDNLVHRFEKLMDKSKIHVSVAPMGVRNSPPDQSYARQLSEMARADM